MFILTNYCIYALGNSGTDNICSSSTCSNKKLTIEPNKQTKFIPNNIGNIILENKEIRSKNIEPMSNTRFAISMMITLCFLFGIFYFADPFYESVNKEFLQNFETTHMQRSEINARASGYEINNEVAAINNTQSNDNREFDAYNCFCCKISF